MKYTASGGTKPRSRISSETMAKLSTRPLDVICIGNDGYEASLEKLKIYSTTADADAEKHGLLRVIDESGESYLYPRSLFLALPKPMATKVKAAMAIRVKATGRRRKKKDAPRRKTAA
jgi:hypothetical protein